MEELLEISRFGNVIVHIGMQFQAISPGQCKYLKIITWTVGGLQENWYESFFKNVIHHPKPNLLIGYMQVHILHMPGFPTPNYTNVLLHVTVRDDRIGSLKQIKPFCRV